MCESSQVSRGCCNSFGLNGEQCVLRSCCEVAEIPMYDREDSVLEKIVQYLFT